MNTNNIKDEPIIKAEQLSVIYDLGRPNQTNALISADLEIYPGEFIIFFGPSGCGKSTLLYSIAGLERNIQGDVFIEGKNLAKFNNEELDNHRQHTIGMIFQAYYLISSLSVLNNVVLPQFSLHTDKEEREKKALDLLEFFGVNGQKEKYPNELSGGQQQRVAICRSLINDPSIILADEPTGNLDSKSANDVMNLLYELNEKKKKTIIVVTHSPGGLEYANRVFYMKDGRIVNVTENRKRNEPIQKSILEANVLAKDLEAKEEKKAKETKTTAGLIASSQGDTFLASIKAQEIVTEALTGLSLEEIDRISLIVEKMIKESIKDNSYDLLKYLDNSTFQNGLGFDIRTATNITSKIKNVIREIKELQITEERMREQFSFKNDPEVTSIRHHIFEAFDIKLSYHKAVTNFDDIVKDRLGKLIDAREVKIKLNMPVQEGGVGIDKRIVGKIAKRIELLILGKI